jgi:hypothetical protein
MNSLVQFWLPLKISGGFPCNPPLFPPAVGVVFPIMVVLAARLPMVIVGFWVTGSMLTGMLALVAAAARIVCVIWG